MAKTIKATEMHDILVGATFLGAGGGGSPEDGVKLIKELEALGKAEARLIDPKEMADDDWAFFVAMVGAPKSIKECQSFPETLASFELIQGLAAVTGRKFKYLMPGEIGGFNTLVPIYVAALKGVPVVDADGCGRAVPEFATTLYNTGRVPNTPFTMAGPNGDGLIINLSDPLNHSNVETIARHVCMAYGMRASFCGYPVTKAMILDDLVPNSVSMCLKVGEAFRASRDIGQLAKALSEAVKAKELFLGQISNIEVKTVGGFDLGITTIRGQGAYSGQSVTIGVKNENIILRDHKGEVVVTVPDLIALVESKALKPLSNADTQVGQEVALFGLNAPANWFKTPKGYDCWRHILEKFDYQGGYVPVK